MTGVNGTLLYMEYVESRHTNFGAIQAIFLQLSWSQHKWAHLCHGECATEEVKGQMEL